MKRFATEFAASVTTLIGMHLGSTTEAGAAWYIVAAFFWFALMFQRRIWGLLPLNTVAACVAWWNFIHAL